MFRQSMDGGRDLNSTFPRPVWAIKIYVPPGPVMDVTALCAERECELQRSFTALLGLLVNYDSKSRGGVICRFHHQII